MSLSRQVYAFAGKLPGDERFGLVTQLQRASVSVPLRFLSIALGSLAELATLVELAVEVRRADSDVSESILNEIEQLRLMLRSLQGSLKAKLPAPSTLLPAP